MGSFTPIVCLLCFESVDEFVNLQPFPLVWFVFTRRKLEENQFVSLQATQTRGEHANFTEKGQVGGKPRIVLLWGNRPDHCSTVLPRCYAKPIDHHCKEIRACSSSIQNSNKLIMLQQWKRNSCIFTITGSTDHIYKLTESLCFHLNKIHYTSLRLQADPEFNTEWSLVNVGFQCFCILLLTP